MSEKPVNDKPKSRVPAMLVAVAGLIEVAVALITVDQTSAVIGIGLLMGALVLWQQTRVAK